MMCVWWLLFSMILGAFLYLWGYRKGARRILNEWKTWLNSSEMED